MSSLFIGLGGVGTGVLDHLNEKMDTYNADLARQGRPQVNAFYYYVDTESARYNKNPQEFSGGGNKIFRQIGGLSPDAIVDGLRRGTSLQEQEEYNLLQHWYDAPAKTTSMIAGADTIRQYSRLAFERESPIVHTDLSTLIQQVTRQQGRIYVITGSCGGTGCGIYMDVLYMISQIYEYQNTAAASMDVRLIMAMPEGYVADGNRDVQYEKKKLNAFATLSELNAMCKDKGSAPPLFNACYIGPSRKQGVFQPFRFGYLYDSAGQKRDEVSQKLSDFLFELELAGDPSFAAAGMQTYNGSFFDGLLTGTVDGNWNASINAEYVQAFNALGQYSIEKPDFLYRTYFSDRLLFDVFHKGLIGTVESVDMGTVNSLVYKLKVECDAEITNTCNTIKDSIVSKDDFKNDARANNTFSVFTKSPNLQEETVKKIIERKNVLLQTIKGKVYSQCKDWLGQYDFTTVYSIMETYDKQAYSSALTTDRDFADQLVEAKKSSVGGFIKKGLDSDKALQQFEPLLSTWLTFEVNKALSSGVDVDITIQNQGYLDHCKSFIERAKRSFILGNEQEHWDDAFTKKVADLKSKNDRSYIPDLSTIVDDQNRIIPESPMVVKYETDVLVKDGTPDFSHGTCTPVTLHERIIGEMKADISLRQEGINMDELFDPTPGRTYSLSSAMNATLFLEKYVATAKIVIIDLLSGNQSYSQLFVNDILTRLQNLPTAEKTRKCLDFVNYNKVQLRTENMGVAAVTQYTYYVVSSTANIPLMQALGILDQAGQKSANTDHTPANAFFGDRIVKLIVKNGYKMDDYHYFAEYKANADLKMNETQTHDPFIDKRFLGELSDDGKYTCDVCAALRKIDSDTSAAQRAAEFSLDGFNDIEIYKYALALLYEYFDILKQDGRIDAELVSAIAHTVGTKTITISQPTYNKLRRKYILSVAKTIDLASLATINNMEDLTTWIEFVMSKKDNINNEAELYGKALEDFDLHLAEDLEVAIGDMMGDGNKPIYDFFTAYLNWYNKD